MFRWDPDPSIVSYKLSWKAQFIPRVFRSPVEQVCLAPRPVGLTRFPHDTPLRYGSDNPSRSGRPSVSSVATVSTLVHSPPVAVLHQHCSSHRKQRGLFCGEVGGNPRDNVNTKKNQRPTLGKVLGKLDRVACKHLLEGVLTLPPSKVKRSLMSLTKRCF